MRSPQSASAIFTIMLSILGHRTCEFCNIVKFLNCKFILAHKSQVLFILYIYGQKAPNGFPVINKCSYCLFHKQTNPFCHLCKLCSLRPTFLRCEFFTVFPSFAHITLQLPCTKTISHKSFQVVHESIKKSSGFCCGCFLDCQKKWTKSVSGKKKARVDVSI